MIVGATWSATLAGLLSGIGFIGTRLMDFTDAVGNGAESHVVGKPFTTTDTGQVPGIGVGTGTGVVGMNSAAMSAGIFSQAVGFFGQSGSRLMDLCDQIAAANLTEMAKALLSSNHTPVFSGAGVVDVGSVGVVGPDWGNAIESAAPSFIGSQWGNFAQALGGGQANEILASGTGNVAISGTFTGSTPPGPVPGAGTGSGTIS